MRSLKKPPALAVGSITHSIPNPDCGCVIHPNQTHEEHMDQLDREMNRETLEKAVKEGRVTPALWNWFCNAEMLRLQDKERNMKLGKIREKV